MFFRCINQKSEKLSNFQPEISPHSTFICQWRWRPIDGRASSVPIVPPLLFGRSESVWWNTAKGDRRKNPFQKLLLFVLAGNHPLGLRAFDSSLVGLGWTGLPPASLALNRPFPRYYFYRFLDRSSLAPGSPPL